MAFQAPKYPWQTELWQSWLSQNDRLAHAYLLTGSDGIGLTQFALDMAQTLLCHHPNHSQGACGECSQCHLFEQMSHPDFYSLEVLEDKKEVGIDQVRALNAKLFQTAHQGGYQVALIKQAEHLNTSAFNALLKTIEEPPAKTVIILTAYQPSRLPATIKSRCALLRFAKPSLETAQAWLKLALPEADDALIKKSLRINWGAPLQALDWINDKQFETEQAWQDSLVQLMQGQLGVSQAVDKWKKWSKPEVVFDYFYLWTVQRIRAASYQQKFPLNHDWLRFQQQVLVAQQAWDGNGNKELILENLCMDWVALNQQGHLPDISPEANPMQGLLLRGML
ncbi:DNA polymerase III subunit delta' [Thiosulfativibrio zosterae]|uniref:DNA-directed DNA polymerase n=1 Tax=Thiosulfativibrio zosterae TaxID=2675053 RepID=A0A6F8PP29_9GAMM|nr:DNA polymerase III subunit delta' [Thiosulfativibrio zosterae]BBP43804.1 DNA polymerase III subunit delta' [Thiosulfativibrio zosterae]